LEKGRSHNFPKRFPALIREKTHPFCAIYKDNGGPICDHSGRVGALRLDLEVEPKMGLWNRGHYMEQFRTFGWN
jgi:hypothetical protein